MENMVLQINNMNSDEWPLGRGRMMQPIGRLGFRVRTKGDGLRPKKGGAPLAD